MNEFFQPHGLFIGGILHLSPKEALELVAKGATIVDVREEREMNGKQFAIGNVVSIPFSALPSEYHTLSKEAPLIIADSVGLKSKKAVLFLLSQGYTKIANLNGGIIDWETAGLPTDVNDDEVLIGQCACRLRPKKAWRPRNP